MQRHSSGFPVSVTDLVPGVSSVCGVDEDGDDLSFGQESCGSLSGHVRVKVVGTLLKVVIWTGVGGQREVLHVPNKHKTCKAVNLVKFALRRSASFLCCLCGWSAVCNRSAPHVLKYIEQHHTTLMFGSSPLTEMCSLPSEFCIWLFRCWVCEVTDASLKINSTSRKLKIEKGWYKS